MNVQCDYCGQLLRIVDTTVDPPRSITKTEFEREFESEDSALGCPHCEHGVLAPARPLS
jgi:DNA-directed RNA polymerase subunit RPC12/RpoP